MKILYWELLWGNVMCKGRNYKRKVKQYASRWKSGPENLGPDFH